MEVRSVKVRVPGTSANCGPGFDCLGVACTIYNELELTLLEEERLDIEITGDGAENIPVDERNIVWRSIQKLLERAGKAQEYKGAIIRMDNGVPLSRGLGSSATAIVGGLKAANECLGNPFTNRDLLQMATEIEGIEAGGIPENARLYYVGNAVSETALRVESENNAVGVLE